MKESADQIIQRLERLLATVREENERACKALDDAVDLTDYTSRNGVWTEALGEALREHQTVRIPGAETPYLIDGTVQIPSDRHIIAEANAVIRLAPGTDVLLFRNASTADGTHAPIKGIPRDRNITVEGGVWEDCCTRRMGYGKSGRYGDVEGFCGVSALMLFENLDRLTLRNMTFRNCGAFAVQLGEIRNVIAEDIRFESCFADGLHFNGNTENVHVRRVSGQVGDDLVAINPYDWQNSSINFGPFRNLLCEDLTLSPDSRYHALRIEPGIYTFDDGSQVDCSLTDAVFRRIENIRTFKLYCQTPKFFPGEEPERGDVGSGDRIVFDQIRVDLNAPIDLLDGYVTGDPVRGSFAAFELGLNVGSLWLRNIDLTLYRDRYPYSYLLCIGPKSARKPDGREVFDPSFSSVAKMISFENIRINGERVKDVTPYLREIVFDRVWDDMPSTASGKILEIRQ